MCVCVCVCVCHCDCVCNVCVIMCVCVCVCVREREREINQCSGKLVTFLNDCLRAFNDLLDLSLRSLFLVLEWP